MKTIKNMQTSMYWVAGMTLVLTLLSEFSKSFEGFLKALTGHHWITKSVIVTLLFIILAYKLPEDKKDTTDPLDAAKRIILAVIGVFVIILGFFVGHYLGWW